jgi:hypothetical protein
MEERRDTVEGRCCPFRGVDVVPHVRDHRGGRLTASVRIRSATGRPLDPRHRRPEHRVQSLGGIPADQSTSIPAKAPEETEQRIGPDRGRLALSAPCQARGLGQCEILASGLAPAWQFTRSPWPDLIGGLGIALMNPDAARKVYGAAREEYRAATA